MSPAAALMDVIRTPLRRCVPMTQAEIARALARKRVGTRYEFRGQWLLAQEIADLIGVDADTVRRRLRAGKPADVPRPHLGKVPSGNQKPTATTRAQLKAIHSRILRRG